MRSLDAVNPLRSLLWQAAFIEQRPHFSQPELLDWTKPYKSGQVINSDESDCLRFPDGLRFLAIVVDILS